MNNEYNRISILLKRYSFENKMAICQYFSRKLMSFNRLKMEGDNSIVYPWELDNFAMFAILTENEYRQNKFEGYNDKHFKQMIMSIRNYRHPHIDFDKYSHIALDQFLMVTGLQQFQLQEDIRFRLFRYNYLFNFSNDKIDMKRVFMSKIGVPYSEILKATFVIYFFFSIKDSQVKKDSYTSIISYLFKKYSTIISIFTINRKNYIEKQQRLIGIHNENAYYSFKYLFPFPFIEEFGILYFPQPYLIIDASTDGLLNRITDCDNALRSKIGKDIIEGYLFEILNSTNLYDAVIPEYGYKKNKTHALTPDVMIRKGNKCVLFDSKSSVPHTKLREFDNDSIKKTITRCAENVVQMYQCILDFNILYFPFGSDITFLRKDIFGVITLLEENYISKKLIYDEACSILQFESCSQEYDYILSNIKVIGLRDIEEASFGLCNYIDRLVIKRDNKSCWYDLSMNIWDDNGTETSISDYFLRFHKQLSDEVQKVSEKMILDGIIQE
jgi:hypothetical protein